MSDKWSMRRNKGANLRTFLSLGKSLPVADDVIFYNYLGAACLSRALKTIISRDLRKNIIESIGEDAWIFGRENSYIAYQTHGDDEILSAETIINAGRAKLSQLKSLEWGNEDVRLLEILFQRLGYAFEINCKFDVPAIKLMTNDKTAPAVKTEIMNSTHNIEPIEVVDETKNITPQTSINQVSRDQSSIDDEFLNFVKAAKGAKKLNNIENGRDTNEWQEQSPANPFPSL